MILGFLASHNGSNAQAVIDACKAGRLRATTGIVISNNSDSGALARARKEKIPHCHLSSQTHPIQEQLDKAILQALTHHHVELVILAGYMRKLGSKTLGYYTGRVINTHPPLLPRFGGQGMFGQRVHEAVLAAGEKETGVTIHLVDEEYDHGAILAQCRLPIYPDDTVTTLSQRVLQREQSFLVETLQKIIARDIVLPAEATARR